MMKPNFYTIFKTFFKVGTLLLGGGYVILPLLNHELVEKKHWISYDELCNFNALSASLPGIIAINTAIFTGRKLNKTIGALAATTGIVLPAFMAIILLATIFTEITSKQCVQDAFWGIGIGILILLFLAVKDIWGKSIKNKFTMVMFILCLCMTFIKSIPLYGIVLFSLAISLIYEKFRKKEVRDE